MKRNLGKSFSVLNTPAVLYIIVTIALVNLLTFLYQGDMRHTMIFVLVGVVTSFFSKNMIVILTVSIAFTGIAKMVSSGKGMEGMTDGVSDNENTDVASSSDADANTATDKKKAGEEDTTENMEGKEEEEEEEVENFERRIQEDGQELIEVQDKIEEGFRHLEPYMDKADQLLTRIDQSMKTLEKKKDLL